MPARLTAFLLLVLLGVAPRVQADVSLTDQQTFAKRTRSASRSATGALTPPASPRLVDGTGLEWFINDEVTYSTLSSAVGAASDAVFVGAVEATTTGGGTELSVLADAFDGYNALDISVDGGTAIHYNNVGAASSSCSGRQINMPGRVVAAGLVVSRKVYVPSNDGFARWLNIVENTSGTPHNVTLTVINDLGSDANTRIGTTSSGDSIADASDIWVTTYEEFTQGSSRTPRLAHVLSSPGALVQPSTVSFANGNDKPTWSYSFAAPAGSKIVIANFAAGLGSLSGAALKAAALAALPPNATACMDSSEIAALGNVTPGPVPSGPEPTGPAGLSILSPTAADSFTATTPFLSLGGIAGPTRLESITWTSSTGASGTALGLSDWTIPDLALAPGVNTVTVVAKYTGLPAISDTIRINRGALSYELPEGATGPFFTTDLLIANPNDIDVDAEVEFLRGDGTKVTMPLQTLPPKSRSTITLNNVPGLSDAAVSSIVRSASGDPLVVERSMFWDSTSYGSHGAAAIDGPRNRFLFAEGAQGFFHTYVLLANPNNGPATTTLTFLPESGTPVTRTVVVPPTSRQTFDVGDVTELLSRSFALTVDADAPIVAERAMYFGGPRLFEGGTDSAGVGQAATEWYFAEGASGFFDTFYLLGNAGSRTAKATLTFQKIGGGVVTVTKDVAPYSRLTVNPAAETDELGAGVSYSLAVRASEPIIAERSMYWGAQQTGNWYEGHNSFGVNVPAMKWGLAEGRVGTDRQFHTYILIGNSSNADSQVRVTYLLPGGGSVAKNYLVAKNSRFNVDVNTMVPELVDQEFGAVVEVISGSPVIVERSLYSSSGGVELAAGTNTAAVRLP